MADTNTTADPTGPLGELAARHVALGWWALLAFLTLGLALEALHGLKAGWYLDVGREPRRLLLTLGHAHGTLLALVNVAFGLTLRSGGGAGAGAERRLRLAGRSLVSATILLPGGFLLGGLVLHGGDPGLGVFLVPLGGAFLFLGVLLTARSVSATGSAPSGTTSRRRKR